MPDTIISSATAGGRGSFDEDANDVVTGLRHGFDLPEVSDLVMQVGSLLENTRFDSEYGPLLPTRSDMWRLMERYVAAVEALRDHPHTTVYRDAARRVAERRANCPCCRGSDVVYDTAGEVVSCMHLPAPATPVVRLNDDYVQAQCSCGWRGTNRAIRTVEGWRIAERDVAEHNCATAWRGEMPTAAVA